MSTVNDNSPCTGKTALLVFPGKLHAPNPQVPLALLHLANPLLEQGFKVRILDMRVENYRDAELGCPVFVGITSMSGQQIKYGLQFAQKVRSELPDCPLVWGGIHATLLPEQTTKNPFVDVVVRGEGEETLAELANKIYTNQPIDNVEGITYEDNGKISSS